MVFSRNANAILGSALAWRVDFFEFAQQHNYSLSKTAGDVILGKLFSGCGEKLLGFVIFN